MRAVFCVNAWGFIRWHSALHSRAKSSCSVVWKREGADRLFGLANIRTRKPGCHEVRSTSGIIVSILKPESEDRIPRYLKNDGVSGVSVFVKPAKFRTNLAFLVDRMQDVSNREIDRVRRMAEGRNRSNSLFVMIDLMYFCSDKKSNCP